MTVGTPSAGMALRVVRFVLDKPLGEWVHVGLAVLYMYLLPVETFPKDLVWHVMALWSTLRLPWLVHRFGWIVRDRLVWLLAAWTAWVALTALWSPDREVAVDELVTWRVAATPLIILPALRCTPWLIAALLAGVLTQNLAQGAQALRLFGMAPAPYGRLGGWMHPITTGAFCVAATCFYVTVLLNHAKLGRWRGWKVAAALGGLAVAATGLVWTGSRGPWISAAAAVPLAAIGLGARRREARRAALALAIVAAAGGAVAWPVAGDFVMNRVDQALDQLTAAVGGDYDSDVGMRIARWRAAAVVIGEHPLLGVGGGGYGPAVQETPYATWIAADTHAHSAYLQELATRGIPGFALMIAVILVIWRRTLLMAPGPLTDALPYVVVSWVVGAAFDCYELNGNLFGLLTVIGAMSLPALSLARDAQYKDGPGHDQRHPAEQDA